MQLLSASRSECIRPQKVEPWYWSTVRCCPCRQQRWLCQCVWGRPAAIWAGTEADPPCCLCVTHTTTPHFIVSTDHHWSSAAPDYLPSATELFLSPLLVSGTVCLNMSPLHLSWLSSGPVWKLICSTSRIPLLRDCTMHTQCPLWTLIILRNYILTKIMEWQPELEPEGWQLLYSALHVQLCHNMWNRLSYSLRLIVSARLK